MLELEREAAALYVDDSEDSKEAEELLKMTGIPYRTQRRTGFNVPSLYYHGDHFKRLVGVGGIEWIMKGNAPEAFELYINGIRPPENTPYRCVLYSDQ